MKKWELLILLNSDHWVCCFLIFCLMKLEVCIQHFSCIPVWWLEGKQFLQLFELQLELLLFSWNIFTWKNGKLWLFRFEYVFGCHILSESVSCSVMSDSWWLRGLWLARLLCPWNSLGKKTGVDSHSLFQGSNLGIPHCRQILYYLSHQGRF